MQIQGSRDAKETKRNDVLTKDELVRIYEERAYQFIVRYPQLFEVMWPLVIEKGWCDSFWGNREYISISQGFNFLDRIFLTFELVVDLLNPPAARIGNC